MIIRFDTKLQVSSKTQVIVYEFQKYIFSYLQIMKIVLYLYIIKRSLFDFQQKITYNTFKYIIKAIYYNIKEPGKAQCLFPVLTRLIPQNLLFHQLLQLHL